MAGWTTLVQADILSVALERPDLVIVDCRFSLLDPNLGEQSWRRSHIPGAAYAHLERDLSDMSRKGEGRHPWPDAETFCAKLGRWDIAPGSQVVAYDDADGAYAARLWFLLRMLGHEKVAVLDGGWTRWTSLGLPASSLPRESAGQYYSYRLGPYITYNLSITKKINDNLTVDFNAVNLTNKQYRSDNSATGYPFYNYAIGSDVRGRRYFIGARYKF